MTYVPSPSVNPDAALLRLSLRKPGSLWEARDGCKHPGFRQETLDLQVFAVKFRAMETIRPTIQLQTDRMVLRPMTADDRKAVIRALKLSSAHLQQWSPSRLQSLSPEADFDRQLQRTCEGLVCGKDLRLIGVLPDDRVAGFFALNEMVRGAFHNAYAGWSVSAEFLRQGFGTEGVQGLLDLAFSSPPHGLGLHRVQANVQPENLPSIALARKLGFREEGLAKRYLDIAGAWRDHLMFAKTVEEHEFRFLRQEDSTANR